MRKTRIVHLMHARTVFETGRFLAATKKTLIPVCSMYYRHVRPYKASRLRFFQPVRPKAPHVSDIGRTHSTNDPSKKRAAYAHYKYAYIALV